METIFQALKEIEKKKKIKILYACETGSRAWGFPSPDSDYDVRFIYRHEANWYLSLNKHKDTIEFITDNALDISGWDLKKSLVMLKKSNASLIERFQSPIEYFSENDFKESFTQLIESYYSPIAVFYHHYSLANKFWEAIKDREDLRLKDCFYLLRSLLSCNWIIRSKEVVPMHIEGLMTLIDEERKDSIRKLVQLKSAVTEKHVYRLESWLNKLISELKNFTDSNKSRVLINRKDYSLLNKFFLKSLYGDVNGTGNKK